MKNLETPTHSVQRPFDFDNILLNAVVNGNKRWNSPDIDMLLSKLGVDKTEGEVKDYEDCKYWNFKNTGISICFDKSEDDGNFIMGAVHIKNLNIPNNRIILPYNIDGELTFCDIIQKFAPIEPEKGGGGRSGLNIWIRYNEYGIMFEFPSKIWDCPELKWSECTVFAEDSNSTHT